MSTSIFPFTAIVGQSDFKLALILNLIEPALGGVLAIGDKGTGKTTLIRSLADLVSKDQPFPFVNLPIGASEDRVLGHVNLERLMKEKTESLQQGLLAKAHKGCLYIDEINLLNDYLMDVLLDASSSGFYHLEREGFSKTIDSRFCLIGSMNPEEGDLRPQLKDRFGLSVDINTIQDINERQTIVKRRLAFDDDPNQFTSTYKDKQKELLNQISKAKAAISKLELPSSLFTFASSLAIKHQVEGHRADILLLKAARAYAAFNGDNLVLETHIETIAPLVLNHRSTLKTDQDNNSQDQDNEQENTDNREPKGEEEIDSEQEDQFNNQNNLNDTFSALYPLNKRQKPTFKRIGDQTSGEKQKSNLQSINQSIALTSSMTVDVRKTVGQYIATSNFELKHKSKESKNHRHLIFILDSSGSMIKNQMINYAKGLIETYSNCENTLKIEFSLVILYQGDASVHCSKIKHKNELIQSLETIKTGGKTNMIAAFKAIKQLAPLNDVIHELIVVTDGKFNYENNQDINQVVLAYKTYCKSIQHTTIIDTEQGRVKLQLAQSFASKINANYELLIPESDENS